MATTQLGRRSSPPQKNTFETRAWQYMRWSGVLLLPLAFIHLAYMHIINSVYVINYHWVIEERWAHMSWRIYDAFLLWFAGLHGFNGLRYVINDYVMNPTIKRVLIIVSIVVLVIVFTMGSVALIGSPFAPDPSIEREIEEGARNLISTFMM
jgi:succinate dehydrogenase / fumarate reductase, membrane anchor subunit